MSEVPATKNRPKILVVDDEPKNLYAMRRLLASLDIEIVEASSGAEALLFFIHADFFLVLMDVRMPDMDGFETASLIAENSELHHTPIIFVTANSKDDHNIEAGYEVGAVDYIAKPIEEKILSSKVNVFKTIWLQGRQLAANAAVLELLTMNLATANLSLKSSNQELEDFNMLL